MRRRTAGGAMLLAGLDVLGRPRAVVAAGPRAVALVTAFTAAWDRGDVDSLVGLFTPNAEIRFERVPKGRTLLVGAARIRAWLEWLPHYHPRIWDGPSESLDGRVRWTGRAFGMALASHEMAPTPLHMEAALAPEGRIVVLCIADTEAGLAATWAGSSESGSPSGAAAAAPSASVRPPLHAGPGEGDYRPIAAGGLLATAALLLARRRAVVRRRAGEAGQVTETAP